MSGRGCRSTPTKQEMIDTLKKDFIENAVKNGRKEGTQEEQAQRKLENLQILDMIRALEM